MSRFNLRSSAAAVVVIAAVAAAVQSFSHIYDLGHNQGESQLNSVLLAVSVDGMILAMSLLILNEARSGSRAPVLAYVMLWAGIVATIGANVLYGVAYGKVGWIASAWPAVAFIGSVHAVMTVVRRSRLAAAPARRVHNTHFEDPSVQWETGRR